MPFFRLVGRFCFSAATRLLVFFQFNLQISHNASSVAGQMNSVMQKSLSKNCLFVPAKQQSSLQ
jgi:hypothetical protein